MSVLTLAGKPINWAKPPSPTTKVMWSGRTSSGRVVLGSLRSIAHLDHLNTLAIKKFGKPITVFQSAFNTSVVQSKGTHDYDACYDVWIFGVPGTEQEKFFRANGAGGFLRVPPSFTYHIHYFTLPPREGTDVSDDYRSGGFKVGLYVDGGWSTRGARVASSQIADYYAKPMRNALASHAPDRGWHPPNIAATIFNLDAYIARQRAATVVKPKVSSATKAEYRWFQPAPGGVALGVRKDFGSLGNPTARVGSPATSEGKQKTGKGIGERLILRGRVTTAKGKKSLSFGALGGHAPPPRAPKARAKYLKVFAAMAAKFKGGDLNLPVTDVKRLLRRGVTGSGVLSLVVPPAATWKTISTRAVDVGGDHKAVLVVMEHRRTKIRVRFLVINAMSVSTGAAKAEQIFRNGLALKPDVVMGSECGDFRAVEVDANRKSK